MLCKVRGVSGVEHVLLHVCDIRSPWGRRFAAFPVRPGSVMFCIAVPARIDAWPCARCQAHDTPGTELV